MKLAVTQRLAMACARRPWRTVGAWGIVLILAIATNALFLGSALTPEGGITSQTDSRKGLDLINDRFPDRDAVSELVVVVADSGSVDDPQVRQIVISLRKEIAKAEAATSATRMRPTP